MGVAESFIINIISGLAVSFIFLFVLLQFYRPKFKISEKICLSTEIDEQGQTKDKYTFKIVNWSIYHAFDAKVELFLMEPVPHAGGRVNLRFQSLSIRTGNLFHIQRFRRRHHKKDPAALFAMLFHTNEPLTEMLERQNTYVELKVTVRHGLTGLAGTFTQQFANPDIIMAKHKFAFGKSLDTMPLNKVV